MIMASMMFAPYFIDFQLIGPHDFPATFWLLYIIV